MIRYFDAERYRKQEIALTSAARTTPSVARFYSVCTILQSGLEAAINPSLDLDLAKRTWISACLELLAENPLASPLNTWKRTLTVADKQIITRVFVKAVETLLTWCALVKDTEPDADEEMWGGLILATFNSIIRGNTVRQNGKSYIALDNEMIVSKMADGSLQLNNRIILELLYGCTESNAKEKYATGPCPDQCKDEVLVGNAGLQFDSTWLCKESEMRISSVKDFLARRIEAYERAKENVVKREILTLDNHDNSWFSYYVKEYCTPTEVHLTRANLPLINADALKSGLAAVESMAQKVTALAARDATDETSARQMIEKWDLIKAKFALRSLAAIQPSYSSQETFVNELSEFFKLFSVSVRSIGKSSNQSTSRNDHNPVPPSTSNMPASTCKDPFHEELMAEQRLQTEYLKVIAEKSTSAKDIHPPRACRQNRSGPKRTRARPDELTQQDVARDFGVSRQQVSKWERTQTCDGPSNKSNPYGYYKSLRTDPKLRDAYTTLANQAKMHNNLIAEAKKKGKRYKLSFAQFQEQFLAHNRK